MDVVQGNAGGAEGAAAKPIHDAGSTEDGLRELDGHEGDSGGGRFNRLLVFGGAGIAMIVGVVVVQGIRSEGVTTPSSATQATDSGADAARNKAEVDELAAGAPRPKSPAVVIPPAAPMPNVQSQVVQRTARPPGRYAQWAEDKYMKALEAPEMVGAFHSASALEIPRAQSGEGGASFNSNASTDPTTTPHPPPSPNTLIAGNVIPAGLGSGINSVLPGARVVPVMP